MVQRSQTNRRNLPYSICLRVLRKNAFFSCVGIHTRSQLCLCLSTETRRLRVVLRILLLSLAVPNISKCNYGAYFVVHENRIQRGYKPWITNEYISGKYKQNTLLRHLHSSVIMVMSNTCPFKARVCVL